MAHARTARLRIFLPEFPRTKPRGALAEPSPCLYAGCERDPSEESMGLSSRIFFIAMLVALSTSASYAQNNVNEADMIAKAVAGSWKNPTGGAFETAVFKAGQSQKKGRGELPSGRNTHNGRPGAPARLDLCR